MRIVVPMKAVPDLVEEIEINGDGTGIDTEYLTFVLGEWDSQALEEALLLKDAIGAEVVAVGLAGDPEIDQILYTALAKGADAAVKLAHSAGAAPPGTAGIRIADRAALLAGYLAAQPADLVISGVQAADDMEGQLPPMLGALLGVPHVSVAVGVELDGASAVVRQEFAGGRSHELYVQMPAVIGVQSARQAPRYAPITRIKQAMQTKELTELTVSPPARGKGAVVRRMHRPETSSQAEMLTGDAGAVADQIVGLLRARGLVKG
ncbi:MAG: electron transfer flavoprotein subunit beta/FixA family protein [Acidimicrobiales bacterium]